LGDPSAEQAELLQAILDTSVAAICVLDTDGRILFANQHAEQVLGLRPSEIVGRSYDAPEWKSTDLDGGPWPDEMQPFTRVKESGEPVFDVRHAIEWPDGQRKLLSINGAPIKDEGGGLRQLVFAVTDITELVTSEQALRDSQEQFLRAQRLESIGRLAGGLAHDFNNLLTAIIGSADLALAGLAEASEEKELVSQIRDAGERGAKLTKQLLAFASRQVVHPQVVDLNERIRRSEELLRRLIGEHIDLSVDLAEGLWPVEVDPGRFEQVLVNLVVNARDAMPDGGHLSVATANESLANPPGMIAAESAESAESAEWVAISVEDSGTGMDEETAGQVFEPFFTTKEASEGTGLGLSTCFGIVRQAGGFLEVESHPGRGTVFRVLLPCTRRPMDEGVAEQRDRAEESGSEFILLVEDDPSVRRVAQKVLERAGYRILEAGAVDAARRAFAEHGDQVDLLISDIVMPQTNGAELAQEFLEQSPGLRVLFVSGYSPDDGPLREMVGHGYHLLQKPFSGSELRNKVREVLDA